jgi:uncharacterized glyoxalase superfamily protein PhnB
MVHRPEGYHTVTPRAVVDNVAGAVAFLRATFAATGELVEGRPAEMRIGDSLVMLSETGERDRFPAFLYVYVDDVDSVYERALAAGATSIEAPALTPYGDHRAMVEDPFGDIFQIAAGRRRPALGPLRLAESTARRYR